MFPDDQIFTPTNLAEKLVNLVRLRKVKTVADFAAGDGELLRAARQRWPKARVAAFDIDQHLVSTLKMDPSMNLAMTQDFLDPRLVAKEIIEIIGCAPDVVVLNPPFSIRSRGLVNTEFFGKIYKSSIALAFIARAIRIVRRDGEVVAILPNGAVTSARDQCLLDEIRHHYHLEVIPIDSAKYFPGHDVKCVFVRLTRSKPRDGPRLDRSITHSEFAVRRGSFDHLRSRYTAKQSGGSCLLPLIHTTCFRSGAIIGQLGWVERKEGKCTGRSAVVLSRVGRPNSGKVVVIDDIGRYEFTKCVILIECSSKRQAKFVRNQIVSQWNFFASLYTGTGAQYITLERVHNFLASIDQKAAEIAPTGATPLGAVPTTRPSPSPKRRVPAPT